MKDEITVNGIKKYLSRDLKFILKDVTESTNTDAKLLGADGTEEGLVVISKTQTAGRGRMDRVFFSPDESGIYMSLILRPKVSAEKSLFITTAAAASAAIAFDELLNVKTDIKWVNDIYLNNKKVCGILTESTFSGDDSFCVLGIGINVYPPANGFPEDIKNKAGFLTDHCRADLKNKIIAKVLDNFLDFYENPDSKEFYRIYKEKNVIKGKIVEVPSKGMAKVLDIDENFHLIVEFEDKTKMSLMTGEVIINL